MNRSTSRCLIGFCIVWLALLIFWGEGFLASRRLRPVVELAD